MKRLFLSLTTIVTLITLDLSRISANPTSEPPLFYTYNGQKIPLTEQQNTIAVTLKPSRTRGSSNLSPVQRLQRDLSGGTTRGTSHSGSVEVESLGGQTVLVRVEEGRAREVAKKAAAQSYVEGTLPVLSQNDQLGEIILPNEMIIQFKAGLSEAQHQKILNEQQVDVIRPIRFTENQYLVRSRSQRGVQVLQVADRLSQVLDIEFATPNLIQIQSNQVPRTPSGNATIESRQQTDRPDRPDRPDRQTNNQINAIGPSLLSMQWHLNSTAQSRIQSGGGDRRVDLRATEAWQQSRQGEGVLVAVLDNLLEWDHPDLVQNVYSVGNVKDKLPNEERGWDFSESGGGDSDTRISAAELDELRPDFQASFKASDESLRTTYPKTWKNIRNSSKMPSKIPLSDREIAFRLRDVLRSKTIGSFHGTMTAGVISAKGNGLMGVAPKAKILPVRVGKLGTTISFAAVVEGLHYAASRGADVINMSFGSPVKNDPQDKAIATILKANSKIVLVASSGNDNAQRVGYPGGTKGVLAVGATNLQGFRSPYSNYGNGLDLVAPGGDVSERLDGGILTTSGMGKGGFWRGMTAPRSQWSPAQDSRGTYVWTEGTSFASPAVAGVVALIKSEDPDRRLTRDEIIKVLKSTASTGELMVRSEERKLFAGKSGTIENYLFGAGLVNAEKAVQAVQKLR
jgi:serine protease